MKFDTTRSLAAAWSCTLCFAGIALAQNAPPANSSMSGTVVLPADSSAAMNKAKPSDADIIATVKAVDTNEIEAAKVAEDKKMGKDALSYAKMLAKQHSDDAKAYETLAKKQKITATTPTAKADELRAQGSEDLKAISALEGKDFEKAYIEAMVSGHKDALQMIDSLLIPNAKNAALKEQLQKTRGHVAAHLEQGKRLQGLQASAPEESE